MIKEICVVFINQRSKDEHEAGSSHSGGDDGARPTDGGAQHAAELKFCLKGQGDTGTTPLGIKAEKEVT